jgi:DNA repair protein RadC
MGRELIMGRDADTIMIHSRRVFRGALTSGAAQIVLAHNNHLAEDLTRTNLDHILTTIMAMAGDALGLPLYNHVILIGSPRLNDIWQP